MDKEAVGMERDKDWHAMMAAFNLCPKDMSTPERMRWIATEFRRRADGAQQPAATRLVEAIRRLLTDGQFDLRDSPKSFMAAVVRLIEGYEAASAQQAGQPAEEARGVNVVAALEMARDAMKANGLTERELPRVFELINAALLAAPAAAEALDFEPDAQHTVADMANVGYALMQAIKRHRPDYAWNESPAEIVGDLMDEIEQAAHSRQAQGGALSERDAFEKVWLYDEGAIPGCIALERDPAGDYRDLDTNSAWEAWQLACKWQRESLARASEPRAEGLTDAARDVLAERQRQISAEGWTPEHDDEYRHHELAKAAACYAMAGTPHHIANAHWPWRADWWKPRDARRNRVKAAALLLADIERMDRAASKKGA